MKLRKLTTASLTDALKSMKIGETCIAPDGYSVGTVRKTCAELKAHNYLFVTSQRSGDQTITRFR